MEMVTLEVEDMLTDSDDEVFPCAPCHEVIPKMWYDSHQAHVERRSPVRPQADRQKRKLSCNTCHRTFPTVKGQMTCMNLAPPHMVTSPKGQRGISSKALVTADRQQAKRLSSMAADRIAAYRAILAKSNNNSTCNVNGKVMSTRPRIQNLKGLFKA